jgi:hypothetical protein
VKKSNAEQRCPNLLKERNDTDEPRFAKSAVDTALAHLEKLRMLTEDAI